MIIQQRLFRNRETAIYYKEQKKYTIDTLVCVDIFNTKSFGKCKWFKCKQLLMRRLEKQDLINCFYKC